MRGRSGPGAEVATEEVDDAAGGVEVGGEGHDVGAPRVVGLLHRRALLPEAGRIALVRVGGTSEPELAVGAPGSGAAAGALADRDRTELSGTLPSCSAGT